MHNRTSFCSYSLGIIQHWTSLTILEHAGNLVEDRQTQTGLPYKLLSFVVHFCYIRQRKRSMMHASSINLTDSSEANLMCQPHRQNERLKEHCLHIFQCWLQEGRIELLDKLEQFPLKIRVKEEQDMILRWKVWQLFIKLVLTAYWDTFWTQTNSGLQSSETQTIKVILPEGVSGLLRSIFRP